MKFTLYGEADGVLCPNDATYAAATQDNLVVDATVQARSFGVSPGLQVSEASALCPELQLVTVSDFPTEVMTRTWNLLLAHSPWVQTVGNQAFYLQLPAQKPPLRETRMLLYELQTVMSASQRVRVGLAENPFLARALVSWSRIERVPGAGYYRVGQHQWILSPTLSDWATLNQQPESCGNWLRNIPISALWDIPSAAQSILRGLGVYRLGDMLRVPVRHFIRHVGRECLRWRQWLEQEPGGAVVPNWPTSQQTKDWQAATGEWVEAVQLSDLLQETLLPPIVTSLQRMGCGGLHLHVSLVNTEQKEVEIERQSRRPIYQLETMMALLKPFISTISGAYTQVSCTVSELRTLSTAQSSFVMKNGVFVSPDFHPAQNLQQIIRSVNRKYPKGIQKGLHPSFRELRMKAILDASYQS